MWSFFSRDPTKDFAYEIGEKVSGLDDRSLWFLHQGKRKVNVRNVYVGVALNVENAIRVHFHWEASYRAMHYSAKRGIAIACCLSVCPSVTLVDPDHIGN